MLLPHLQWFSLVAGPYNISLLNTQIAEVRGDSADAHYVLISQHDHLLSLAFRCARAPENARSFGRISHAEGATSTQYFL